MKFRKKEKKDKKGQKDGLRSADSDCVLDGGRPDDHKHSRPINWDIKINSRARRWADDSVSGTNAASWSSAGVTPMLDRVDRRH